MRAAATKILAIAFCALASLAGLAVPLAAQSVCMEGGRWNLMAASDFLAEAEILAGSLGDSDCRYDKYPHCQKIMAAVSNAHDHIYQVFDQNNDNIANCKRCDYTAAINAASVIVRWERWLQERYFGEASGIGNIHLTILQHKDIPSCAGSGGTVPGDASMEAGVNRPGLDFRQMSVGNDPAQCRGACEADGKCRAWTFVRPGIQSVSAQCWLKHSVPSPVASNCCTSGVVAARAPAACPTRYGDTFHMTPNAAIEGRNREILNGMSLDQCRRACLGTGWCVSFDFGRDAGTCHLQDLNTCDTVLKYDYPGNPWDHYNRNGLN